DDASSFLLTVSGILVVRVNSENFDCISVLGLDNVVLNWIAFTCGIGFRSFRKQFKLTAVLNHVKVSLAMILLDIDFMSIKGLLQSKKTPVWSKDRNYVQNRFD